ncbi:MAG: RNA polymerase sigma-70 factor [Bacteroidia bacterium]|nr:RNA polymerase sigma-70 factor [Bacteroidia bacterium]
MESIDLIVRRIQKGDESAFDQLYSRFSKKVFHVAFAILRTDEEAYEVVQETFLKIWFKRSELDPTRSIEAYLSTVARNFALKIIKKSIRETLLEDLPEIISPEETDDNILMEEFQQKLEAALSHIPPRSREVLLLSRKDGLSNAQIAEKLGISLSTVNNHIHRALNGLKDQLQVPLTLILIFVASYTAHFQGLIIS